MPTYPMSPKTPNLANNPAAEIIHSMKGRKFEKSDGKAGDKPKNKLAEIRNASRNRSINRLSGFLIRLDFGITLQAIRNSWM